MSRMSIDFDETIASIYGTIDPMTVLKKEIENLMSLKYMAETPSFVSKLDDDGYIPLSYLMSNSTIKSLSVSVNDVINTVKSIDSLSLSPNEEGVRISMPVARKTLILRDLPSEATEEVVRALFDDFRIESIKKEIASSWFVTMSSEEEALNALRLLQMKSINDEPLKVRVKSEFYMKVFMRRLQTVMAASKAEQPTRKLSCNATPFVMPSDKMDAITSKIYINEDEIPLIHEGAADYASYWNDAGFDVYSTSFLNTNSPDVPFVITSSTKEGYDTDFVRYSPDDILSIVHRIKDVSLPPIATPGDHSIAIVTVPNLELIEKGRTMSIDQALEHGRPRMLSVDSVDYTNMVGGEIEEDVVEIVRKQRRHHNNRRNGQSIDRDFSQRGKK